MKYVLTVFLSLLVNLAPAAMHYLPAGVGYDSHVTTPEAFLGYEVGSRHAFHWEIAGYMRQLARESDRVQLVEYGRTHGGRPLLQLVITSPGNQANLEQIREQHARLADPDRSGQLDLDRMPVVVNLNYSVHGNEPSGANASMLMAWYLAAARGDEVEQLLDGTVVILDPSLNPDGLDRFANWTNNYSGKQHNPDPNTREHNEDWPGGRTNYYFFDLNRDWMLLTQPESRGRMEQYRLWLPNFVLDFHEMGTNSTYFFQPGVPARNHPLTPGYVYGLTEEISRYFAEALDATGSLYFSQERFDDFYMGKGSSIADLKGAIGLLFEQASSRGMVQDSVNGEIDFPFTIRNQVTVSLAVLKAADEKRGAFLEHTRRFFKDSLAASKKAGLAGYRFASPEDPERAKEFVRVLRGHDIEVQPVRDEEAWYIPARQPHFLYLQALVEQRKEFEENIFYDITAWTLPLAYNLEWSELDQAPDTGSREKSLQPLAESRLGYLADWSGLNAPAVLFDLMDREVIVKVARESFVLDDQAFGYGTLFIPVSIQPGKAAVIHEILARHARESGVRIHPVSTFLTPEGIDLGSNSFWNLEPARILIAAGDRMDSYDTGSVWHLFDVLQGEAVTLMSPAEISRADLSGYTAVILPDSWSGALPEGLADKLAEFARSGGSVVCLGSSAKWAVDMELVSLGLVGDESDGEEPVQRRPFNKSDDDASLQRIRGAIFQTVIDRTHPLAYGYTRDTLPVFVEEEFFLERSANPYQTPLAFSKEPLLAGYASPENLEKMSGTAAAVVESQGKGAVILFGFSPTFRAYWRGTEKLLLNAVLFGPMMQAGGSSGY